MLQLSGPGTDRFLDCCKPRTSKVVLALGRPSPLDDMTGLARAGQGIMCCSHMVARGSEQLTAARREPAVGACAGLTRHPDRMVWEGAGTQGCRRALVVSAGVPWAQHGALPVWSELAGQVRSAAGCCHRFQPSWWWVRSASVWGATSCRQTACSRLTGVRARAWNSTAGQRGKGFTGRAASCCSLLQGQNCMKR